MKVQKYNMSVKEVFFFRGGNLSQKNRFSMIIMVLSQDGRILMNCWISQGIKVNINIILLRIWKNWVIEWNCIGVIILMEQNMMNVMDSRKNKKNCFCICGLLMVNFVVQCFFVVELLIVFWLEFMGMLMYLKFLSRILLNMQLMM